MARADFNLSDELDDDNDQGTETAIHDGEGDDDDRPGEGEDRGDLVGEGDDEGAGDGDGQGGGEGDGAGAGDGDDIDPELLEELAGTQPPKLVPYARLAEVTRQNQQLTEILRDIAPALRQGGEAAAPAPAPAPEFDLKAKIRERNAALLEGDEDKAVELDVEIEEYRTAQATALAQQQFETKRETERVQSAIAEGFEKYPFLSDGDPDTHNPEALADVMMYRNRYLAEGVKMHEAIARAIEKVGPMYAEGGAAPAPAPAPAAAGQQQRARTVVRNAQAERQQPPNIGRQGNGNRETIDPGKLDFANMSEEQFENLPEAVKARARGDVA